LNNLQKALAVAFLSLEDNLWSNPELVNMVDEHKDVVAALQKHWRYSIHSKDKDVLCWPSDKGVCYDLPYQELGFWAVKII
jgi:hypothetical protein